MTTRYEPPFPLPRWRRGGDADPAFVKARDRLLAALAGDDSEISRPNAVHWLQKTGWPGATQVIGKVLLDTDQSLAARTMAANSLWRTNTADAITRLVEASRTDSLRVRTAVIQALGRIGGAETAAAVRRVGVCNDRRLLRTARFAEALIAHRHGLPSEAPGREAVEEWTPARDSLRIAVKPADRTLLAAGIRGLERSPFGIGFAPDRGYEIVCLRSRLLLTFNEKSPVPSKLGRRPALTAIVASWAKVEDDWTPSHVLLTSPGNRTGTVQGEIFRSSGRRIAVVHGIVKRGVLSFEIVGLREPGGFPLRLRATIDDQYRLDIDEARVGHSTDKRVVQPHFPPPRDNADRRATF